MDHSIIQNLLDQAEDIEELFLNLVDSCDESERYPPYIRISMSAKPLQRELLREYEKWYAAAAELFKQYFREYKPYGETYQKMKKYILLDGVSETKKTFKDNFIRLFDSQVNVLHRINSVINIRNRHFKKIITSDLLSSELDQAELLYDKKFYRAAGLIAGVVLERYLKTLCEIHSIPFDRTTIDSLATKLYKSDKLPDFDNILLKSIQHLASIRNKCAHPKEDPKPQEVRELLDKVKKITFLSL